jgi:hypothetical protein
VVYVIERLCSFLPEVRHVVLLKPGFEKQTQTLNGRANVNSSRSDVQTRHLKTLLVDPGVDNELKLF